MKSKFTWIFTLLLAFFIQFAFAQEKTITGVVNDASGMPIPGVVVKVQGSSAAAVQTDFDGKYSIQASQGQTLTFQFIGMEEKTAVVGASSTVPAVVLKEGVELQNVVVEAYRTTTRPLSTIAVTTVTSKTIEGRPNANFIQTLQGQVPGLNISTGSGQPGANSTVILRGYGSINGNVEPLYVIDGVPLNADNFKSLNPNDIESISVLKDAGATSIYGNRGANGVIVVKTKRGEYNSALQIKYLATTGFSDMQRQRYNVMNSKQALTLEKTVGRGFGSTLTDEQIAAYPVNTDWKDVFFQTGVYKNHTLSLSSGGKNLSSFTSINYFDQEGIVRGTDLKKFNFRNNITGKSDNGRFNYSTAVSLNYSVTNTLGDSEGTAFVNTNPILGALQGVPYISPSWYVNGAQLYDVYAPADTSAPPAVLGGIYTTTPGSLVITPLMLYDRLQGNNYINQDSEIKAIGSMQGSYKITDDITAGGTFGMDYTNRLGEVYNGVNAFNANVFFPTAQGYDYKGSETQTLLQQVLFNVNTTINYNKTFAEKHTVDFSVFTEYFKAHYKTFGYTQEGLDPKITVPGAGTGYIPYDPANPNLYVPTVSASQLNAGLFSYFASADYDYSAKYGLSATIRRDASYRFSDTNRWGTYWSVSGRWNIDQESFMQGSVFDMLKLRGSYGTAGNQNIDGQSIFGGARAARTVYALGSGYNAAPGYIIPSAGLGNNDLRWETITQSDIGIDYALFSNRLRGTFDVYDKVTTDLYTSGPLSAVTGFPDLNTNNGKLSNKGIEGLITYDLFPSSSDFQLTLTANASVNQSKIEELSVEGGRYDYGNQVIQTGRRYLEYYTVKYAGVNPVNGNLLFYTADGRLTENPDTENDRVLTGKSEVPKYQGGFGFEARYKGFYLTTQFNFVADVYRFDYDLSGLLDPTSINNFNHSKDLLNAWTPDNRITDVPSLTASNASIYDDTSDRFLVDSSYLRLRYLSLGYNVPKSLLEKTFFTSARIFGQAENIVTWSKWRGWDAESNRGSDQNNYPTPKIFSVGVEVQF